MQPIYPITEIACRNLYGKHVLIYLKNGSEIYGVLSRFEKNKLVLGDGNTPKLSSSTKKTKKNTSKAKTVQTKKTNAQADPSLSSQVPVGYSFFGLPLLHGTAPGYPGAIDIELESIAAMFSE